MATPDATPLRFLCAVAIRGQMGELLDAFARSGGPAVEPIYDLNPVIPQRIIGGEPFDLAITNPWHVRPLIDDALVEAITHRPFGRVPLAVGARAAPARPLTTAEEIRALLLDAPSIAYTSEGTSGQTFLRVAKRLGVDEEIAPRTLPMGAGGPVAAAASGEAALAIAPLTTVIAAEGVETAAIFPSEVQADIDMSVVLGARTTRRDDALRLLDFLTAPALDSRLAGMGVVRFSFD